MVSFFVGNQVKKRSSSGQSIYPWMPLVLFYFFALLCLRDESPWLLFALFFYERAFCLPPFFLIQNWLDTKGNHRFPIPTGKTLLPLTDSCCFFFFLQGCFSCLSCVFSLKPVFLRMQITLPTIHSRFDTILSRQSAALAHVDSRSQITTS